MEGGVVDKGDVLETSIPYGQAKDVYLLHMLNKLAAFDRTIENLEDITSPKPRLMARACLIGMLNDPIRDKMLRAFDEDINKFKVEEHDNERRAELILLTSQNAVAQVYSYLDEFLGVSKKLVIGKI